LEFFILICINIYIYQIEIRKPLSEQREFRIITLPNKIDAILISDKRASKSSASLSVGVGSFMDDEDALGLAHFCEHMLFLVNKFILNL
jgi:insulysin